MRLFAILTLLVVLSSCGAQYHIQRAETHREKALSKGAIFTNDTIRIDGDTTIVTYFKNDTLFLEREVVKTVFVEGEIRYITRVDKRREYKIIRQRNRLEAKQERIATRQENKTERTKVRQENKRSLWWLFLLIGFVIGILFPLIKKLVLKYLG